MVWWAGPGISSRIRVLRGGRRLLRFQGFVFLGVHWNKIRLFRGDNMTELALRCTLDPETHRVAFEAEIGHFGEDETFVLHASEDATAVPPVALALDMPRRGFATRDWCFA